MKPPRPLSATIDNYSGASLPLRVYSGEKELGHATGFFWKHGSELYLVTNWHVASGRNPASLQSLDRNAALPDRLEYVIFHFSGDRQVRHVNLYEEGEPVWLVHPDWKRGVDVVAIRIDEFPEGYASYKAINTLRQERLVTSIGMSLFVLGFPFGPARHPVWKQATIASEPGLALLLNNHMLIDTLSRPGMSGSPVIQRAFGQAVIETTPLDPNNPWSPMDGELRPLRFPATKFIGVYSGRLHTDSPIDAQLGMVWREHLLQEILEGNTRDTNPDFQRSDDLPA
jgi:hypothetical protein